MVTRTGDNGVPGGRMTRIRPATALRRARVGSGLGRWPRRVPITDASDSADRAHRRRCSHEEDLAKDVASVVLGHRACRFALVFERCVDEPEDGGDQIGGGIVTRLVEPVGDRGAVPSSRTRSCRACADWFHRGPRRTWLERQLIRIRPGSHGLYRNVASSRSCGDPSRVNDSSERHWRETDRVTVEGSASSLAWDGDIVVDLAFGNQGYGVDDSRRDSNFSWGFPFDMGVVGPSGIVAVARRRGTKGLVAWGAMRDQELREINRSYYCADAYDYPLMLFAGPNERVLLAHCPDSYTHLEIEDAITGERLSTRGPAAIDFFHSRLSVSPSGRWLASAGWVWHPVAMLHLVDLTAALSGDPEALDRPAMPPLDISDQEIAGVAWTHNDHLVISTTDEGLDNEDAPPLPASGIGCFDVASKTWCFTTKLDQPAGELMDLGDHRHVLALHQHPRLLDARTGIEVAGWPDLPTGANASPIDDKDRRPTALDPVGHRFAVASDWAVTIISLGHSDAS